MGRRGISVVGECMLSRLPALSVLILLCLLLISLGTQFYVSRYKSPNGVNMLLIRGNGQIFTIRAADVPNGYVFQRGYSYAPLRYPSELATKRVSSHDWLDKRVSFAHWKTTNLDSMPTLAYETYTLTVSYAVNHFGIVLLCAMLVSFKAVRSNLVRWCKYLIGKQLEPRGFPINKKEGTHRGKM